MTKRRRIWVGVLVLALAALAFTLARGSTPAANALAGCRIYVASGDDIPAGHDLNDDSSRYPEKLLADHLKSPGWCLFNQGKNGQTSSSYISGGGLSSAYNMRPDLLTIQLGEQNTPMVNIITSCFDKIKDHDFSGGNACAAQVLGNSSLWSNMTSNFTMILQQTRIMQPQRPQLVVAVVNYADPFPQASDVTSKITELCTKPVDTDRLRRTLGAAAAGPDDDRPGVPEAEQDAEGRDGAVPGGTERQSLGLRRHLSEVQESRDEDGRHAPRRPGVSLCGTRLIHGQPLRIEEHRHGQSRGGSRARTGRSCPTTSSRPARSSIRRS